MRMNYKKLELMNSKQRVDLSRKRICVELGFQPRPWVTGTVLAYERGEINGEQFNSAAKKLETMNTDWFDILYRTPLVKIIILVFPEEMRILLTGLHSILRPAKHGQREWTNSYSANLNVTSTFGNN
ncbi:MAG: hypothetical protein ACLU4N_12210 [Butyricimonas faecihominis]